MATVLPAPGASDVLYLIDLSSYVLRAYHAIAPLTNSKGEPTHAVYVTVTMLERLIRERQPELLAVAMDSGRQTFRQQIYPEYKANRPPAPDDLKHQLRRCEQIVRAFSIPILKQDGVEADDLIACAVHAAREHKKQVVIVAADKDLMQLVSDTVVMWDTMRDRVFGPAEVEERFGVRVSQLRDLLALMGDSSDNIPGVPHVGPKTARDLLVQFGSIEGIYARLEEISKKKLKENLAEHKQQALLSQSLVTLKEDCPIEFSLSDLRYGGRNVAELRKLYAELEFRRQLEALDDLPVQPEPVVPAEPRAPAEPTALELVQSRAALEALVIEARTRGRVALALELGSEAATRAPLLGLGLSPKPGLGFYVPLGHRYLGAPAPLSREDLSPLRALLADPGVTKVAHDLKKLRVVLERHDYELCGPGFDVGLASYLLDPEARHEIEPLAKAELGSELPTFEELLPKTRGQQQTLEQVPETSACRHLGTRADATLQLWQRLSGKLADAGLTKLYDELELPLGTLLAELEERGVLVDTERLRELGRVCQIELEKLERRAHEIAGKPFNVHSPRQLETILFDECGLKPLRRTKTSRSTDADTLEALAEEHELPKVILDLRQVAKLKGTYIDALPELLNPRTGRIHTRWEQTVAATGRLSSNDPNLQNIPIRTELGRSIRSAFVAPPGHAILSADYSQIELRVLAHLSQDPVLLDAFRTGQDIHTRTAMEIFGVAEADVTREMRTRCKAVNFGVIYGQGDSGLSKAIGISRTEAQNFIAAYFQRYQGVRRFMAETLEHARESDSVQSLLGRRRLVPDIRHGNRARRLAAERIAMNMPIQGSAADILKLAMLALAKPATPGTRMVLTVHDELVFEVPDAELELAAERVKQTMQNVYPLDVPLVVDVGHGQNWNAAH